MWPRKKKPRSQVPAAVVAWSEGRNVGTVEHPEYIESVKMEFREGQVWKIGVVEAKG